MEQLDLYTLYVVFYEMMGGLLWLLLALAVFGIVGFIIVFAREGGLRSRRLILSEIIGLVGGVLALVIMAKVTVSGFTDAGGPIDWLLVGLIWGIGLAGTTILSYALLGLMGKFGDPAES